MTNLSDRGYSVLQAVLSAQDVAETLRQLSSTPISGAGSRHFLAHPWCRELAGQLRSHPVLSALLPPRGVAVQCTYLDKGPDRNWLVAPHQDLAIPVLEQVAHPALGAWSEKEGQHFVQAPEALLEQLLAVRLHLDDCGSGNGPLRVVPGSHRHGRLSAPMTQALRAATPEVPCLLAAGDVLVMRPLLLHASSRALAPGHRRVLHFLFGPESPGYGLEWPYSV